MFKCQILGKVSEPGEKLTKIVVEVRPKTYYATYYNEELRREETVVVAQGFETVKEINVSEEGVQVWNEMSDLEREKFKKSFLNLK